MIGEVILPVMGVYNDQRNQMIVSWFVKPVARRLMSLNATIRTVYFAVGRFTDGSEVRTDYHFIASDQAGVGWPFAASTRQNELLGSGENDVLVKRALLSLYGAEHPTFADDALARIFAPYTRDVHREGVAVNQAFAPYLKLDRVDSDPNSWEGKRMAFTVRAQIVGSVLNPELIQDEPVRWSNEDPRDYMDRAELASRLNSAKYLESQLESLQNIVKAAENHRTNPTPELLAVLRQALAIRAPVATTVVDGVDEDELGDL